MKLLKRQKRKKLKLNKSTILFNIKAVSCERGGFFTLHSDILGGKNIFSFYLDVIEKISELLGSQCTEPINGSVTPNRRQEIIDDFDNAPAGKVLISQIIAGGTGLNIQSASVVIFCEPQLKPSIENQAIARAYRMGQARNVLVYRLLCENTIDERITEMLAEKQAIFNAFADKSVAADNVEVDVKSLGNIIKEEIDRINRTRKNTGDER